MVRKREIIWRAVKAAIYRGKSRYSTGGRQRRPSVEAVSGGRQRRTEGLEARRMKRASVA